MNRFIKDLIIDFAIAAVLAGVVLLFVRPTIVRQTSMQDTLQPNDYLIIYKRAYVKETPKRGDIIVFESDLLDENGKNKLLVKRVIGLPGDHIQISGGQLYINGEKYSENYLKDGITTGSVDQVVPDNEYFVMGDNRVVSIDSRYDEVGNVTVDEISGKVVFRLYPFNKIGKIK